DTAASSLRQDRSTAEGARPRCEKTAFQTLRHKSDRTEWPRLPVTGLPVTSKMRCPGCDSVPNPLPRFCPQISSLANEDRPTKNVGLHALFISAFPKLPCACSCRCRCRAGAATMGIDINYLAAEP